MELQTDFRNALEQFLDSSEINDFENGNIVIYISDPKYRYLAIYDDKLVRVNIERHRPLDPPFEITYDGTAISQSAGKSLIEEGSGIETIPIEQTALK